MIQNKPYLFLFFVLLVSQIFIWLSVRHSRPEWSNVPPANTLLQSELTGLGDKQFAFRILGLMVQNFGDNGGRSTQLEQYNYEHVSDWLFHLSSLDQHSRYPPFLGSFYFGAVKNGDKLRPLIEYLRDAGKDPGNQNWRWLGQAVYLARFEVQDLDLAYELALELASIREPNMPAWTQQMPAFILNAKGNKEESVAVMLELLRTSSDEMDPAEVYFTKEYICQRLLEPEKARQQDLCREFFNINKKAQENNE